MIDRLRTSLKELKRTMRGRQQHPYTGKISLSGLILPPKSVVIRVPEPARVHRVEVFSFLTESGYRLCVELC